MTKPKLRKYRVMKYDGDDTESNAVFDCADVKGMRSPIISGQATPLVCGCTLSDAKYYKDIYEKKGLFYVN